jgi:hypothetical protein
MTATEKFYRDDVFVDEIEYTSIVAEDALPPLQRDRVPFSPAMLSVAAVAVAGILICATPVPVSASRATVIEPRPGHWRSPISGEEILEAVDRRLAALAKLPVGWAGRDTEPIDREVLSYAREVFAALLVPGLSTPAVVPTPDGGVQFEWHTRNFDGEVTVLGHHEVDIFLRDRVNDRRWEFTDVKSINALKDAIDRLNALV